LITNATAVRGEFSQHLSSGERPTVNSLQGIAPKPMHDRLARQGSLSTSNGAYMKMIKTVIAVMAFAAILNVPAFADQTPAQNSAASQRATPGDLDLLGGQSARGRHLPNWRRRDK